MSCLSRTDSHLVSKINELQFDELFDECDDIPPSYIGKVISLNKKKLMTSGCASCLGVAARIFSADNTLMRVGLHHYFCGEEFEEFLQKTIHPKKGDASKVDRVYLYIYGGHYGHNAEGNHNYRMLRNAIEENNLNDTVIIKELVLNPWNMSDNWDSDSSNTEEVEQLEAFSLKMGINLDGQVYVADSKGKLEVSSNSPIAFSQYPDYVDEKGALKQIYKDLL